MKDAVPLAPFTANVYSVSSANPKTTVADFLSAAIVTDVAAFSEPLIVTASTAVSVGSVYSPSKVRTAVSYLVWVAPVRLTCATLSVAFGFFRTTFLLRVFCVLFLLFFLTCIV